MRISDWSSDVCSSDLVAEGSLVAGGVSGVLLSSEQMVVRGLNQGCTPIGAPHVITEAEGARGPLKTIDDRPAGAVLREDNGGLLGREIRRGGGRGSECAVS